MEPAGVTDSSVVVFPHAQRPSDSAQRLSDAREAHLDALRAWLLVQHPSREDAEWEVEQFAAAARQMAALYSRRSGG